MSATSRYRPELDGVRALAIAGVVAQHLKLHHVRAGSLGVDVFFVLSGYLITGLLATEHRETGRVNLKSFYVRRALRLYPALLAVLVFGSMIVVWDFGGSHHTALVGGVIAATYLTDIVSYTHASAWALWGFTWSLSIEEHFYLMWPALFRRSLGRRTPPVVYAAGAAIILLVIGEITARSGGAGPARDYFQIQAHGFAILAGCALALVPVAPWLRHIALPCLLGIVVVMIAMPAPTSASYIRVAVPVVALLSCGLIAGMEPGGLAVRLLGWAPIRRVGVISYGIYLYHQITIRTVEAHLDLSRHALLLVDVVVVLLVAEISYRFYESPIRARGRRTRTATAPAPAAAAAP